LFNVVDLPVDFGNSQIYADRPKSDQVQELAYWLFNRQSRPGAASLQQSNPDLLTLIAEAQPVQVPSRGGQKSTAFSAPLVGEKKEPTEASLKAQSVSQGMLVVFYEDESDQPAWFQWLAFEPIEPADATVEKSGEWLRPLADVLDVFQKSADPNSQQQRNRTERTLAKSWIPAGSKDEPKPAATLTTVSDEVYQQNRPYVKSLNLKNIFQGQSLIPQDREGPALLLLNLLGIPNYGIFELRGGSINQASFRDRLTGIRVASLPGPGWESYPRTWSLIGGSEILKTTDDSSERDVYLRAPDDAMPGQMQIELLLPILKGEVLGKAENDFELTWRNGPVSKLFPNQRKHFVQASESGLNFWSTVRAHVLTDSSESFFNESVLEIRRTSGKRELLGSWRFITRPPVGPGINVRLSKETSTISGLPQVTVDIDISRIKPALNLKAISLSVDGKGLKNSTRFLQVPARSNGSGKFKFPYNDLVRELGVGKIGSHEIQIQAKTFFGEDESAFARLEIKPNPKPIEVKPKDVLIHVGKVTFAFANPPDDPIDEFTSLLIDGKIVPWFSKQAPGETMASRQYALKQLVVYEIPEGKHDIQLTVVAGDTTVVAEGEIEVRKTGQVFKLKPAKTK
jgi:hypothetical protein